jgi:hypothetical protein
MLSVLAKVARNALGEGSIWARWKSSLDIGFVAQGGIDGAETASACDIKGSYAPGVRTLGKRGVGTERDHHAGPDPAGRDMQ